MVSAKTTLISLLALGASALPSPMTQSNHTIRSLQEYTSDTGEANESCKWHDGYGLISWSERNPTNPSNLTHSNPNQIVTFSASSCIGVRSPSREVTGRYMTTLTAMRNGQPSPALSLGPSTSIKAMHVFFHRQGMTTCGSDTLINMSISRPTLAALLSAYSAYLAAASSPLAELFTFAACRGLLLPVCLKNHAWHMKVGKEGGVREGFFELRTRWRYV